MECGYDVPGLSGFILTVESTIDPIHVLTGELYFTESDIHLPTPGILLVFERYYSSEEGWRNTFAWEFKAIRDKRNETRTVHVMGDHDAWAGLQSRIFTDSEKAADDLKHILLRTGEGQNYRFEQSDAEPGLFKAEAIDWEIVFGPNIENGRTNGYRYALHQPGGIVYGFGGAGFESTERCHQKGRKVSVQKGVKGVRKVSGKVSERCQQKGVRKVSVLLFSRDRGSARALKHF